MDGASPVTDANIEIRQIDSSRGIREWLEVPAVVFAGDPTWIAPLNLAERQRISPRHSPFFTFGEAAFFVALRDGRPVGRISAQINRRHLEHYKDATGHFGFFNAIDDERIARALVEAAAGWLRAQGMRQMVGPFNLSVNEDIGLLISGFDTPPAILSSHARPWEGPLLEACGLSKVVDLLAYRMRPAEAPEQIARLAALARKFNRVKVRSFDMSRYAEDVGTVFDIFNDAWSDNWSFVPASEAEIASLTRETRPFMKGKFGRIAEVDGVPSAMIVALPDLNNVMAGFRGRLLPFNWAKLLLAIDATAGERHAFLFSASARSTAARRSPRPSSPCWSRRSSNSAATTIWTGWNSRGFSRPTARWWPLPSLPPAPPASATGCTASRSEGDDPRAVRVAQPVQRRLAAEAGAWRHPDLRGNVVKPSSIDGDQPAGSVMPSVPS